MLYAEMKLPGEAWLEFKIEHGNTLVQTATFRPKGILGRLYWYILVPFHNLIFNTMARRITTYEPVANSGRTTSGAAAVGGSTSVS